jgi:hypothetical protein
MKILGSEFAVEYMDNVDSNDMGDCCIRAQRLRIQKHQHLEAKLETLFHEILEAINIKLETNLQHDKITALSCGFYAVMRDNGISIEKLLPKDNHGRA